MTIENELSMVTYCRLFTVPFGRHSVDLTVLDGILSIEINLPPGRVLI